MLDVVPWLKQNKPTPLETKRCGIIYMFYNKMNLRKTHMHR